MLLVDTSRVLSVILAGGDATRFMPLSLSESKPACPIGGNFRLIDISLSNHLHSGLTHIYVVVQRFPETIISHLRGYENGIAQMRGQFIRPLTPPKEEARFFESDADSLVQLKRTLVGEAFDYVVISMADQVMRMNYRGPLAQVIDTKADALLVTMRVPVSEARNRLGVVNVKGGGIVDYMEEKPANPQGLENDPEHCLGNVALYVMRSAVFEDMLNEIAKHEPHQTLSTKGIPYVIKHHGVIAYPLESNTLSDSAETPPRNAAPFFDDAGTVDAWFKIQMQACRRNPPFNFYDEQWPILTAPHWPMSPAKVDNLSKIDQALLGLNVIVQDGATLQSSVLSMSTKVGANSLISESIAMNGSQIGANCRVHRTVIGTGVVVPPNTVLDASQPPDGCILIRDAIEKAKDDIRTVEIRPMLSDSGILVVPSGYTFP